MKRVVVTVIPGTSCLGLSIQTEANKRKAGDAEDEEEQRDDEIRNSTSYDQVGRELMSKIMYH